MRASRRQLKWIDFIGFFDFESSYAHTGRDGTTVALMLNRQLRWRASDIERKRIGRVRVGLEELKL